MKSVVFSGISEDWTQKEYFGEILSLKKDQNGNINEKLTIETKEDCYEVIDNYCKRESIDTNKFGGFAVDGAQLALGDLLCTKYSYGAMIIWGTLHGYSLIFKNTLNDNIYYITFKSGAMNTKSYFDNSNVNKQQLEHMAQTIQLNLKEFVIFDEIRYVFCPIFVILCRFEFVFGNLILFLCNLPHLDLLQIIM